MKIVQIEYWPVTMELTEPYAIAYETIHATSNVLVRIELDSGISGYGCAAPDMKVTGESTDSVLQVMAETVEPVLKGEDPFRLGYLMSNLKVALTPHPSARAAVDMALYDLMGIKAGLPLWKLLGGYRDHMKTSITVGILPVDETVKKARYWIQQGFKCLKIKGGQHVEADIERVLKVREAVGPDVELRFDANQGYLLDDTLRFVEAVRSASLEILEQPTPGSNWDLLAKVTKKVSIPVMADESVMSMRDAFKLAQEEIVDMVNVKLMKSGGIFEALQINVISMAAGLEVMVGCMDECALSISAGLQFALAMKNVRYADLDGHINLIGDPTNGTVDIRDGILYPNDLPGLGYRGHSPQHFHSGHKA